VQTCTRRAHVPGERNKRGSVCEPGGRVCGAEVRGFRSGAAARAADRHSCGKTWGAKCVPGLDALPAALAERAPNQHSYILLAIVKYTFIFHHTSLFGFSFGCLLLLHSTVFKIVVWHPEPLGEAL